MTLSFSRRSIKFLAKCGLKTRTVIIEAIGELPGKGDIRKLKGQTIKNTFRLRVGKYRVVYVDDGDEIRILKIDTRGDIYR
ncbi:MAG: type II toxin-antitoxin system RelE/ParE family toxin [Candidatus Moduliflexus flocculans]|jgi:mRNA interferase RelE/StbE|nr:type II toxin-antitoxin system RelE/ParE family toxin [Candidatus Moduliflexus flocculans]